MSTQETKKVVYSLDLLCLQLPGRGQARSVQLCTKGWVRPGVGLGSSRSEVASTQPGLHRKEVSKETRVGGVCLSGREAVCIQGGVPLFHTSVTLVK